MERVHGCGCKLALLLLIALALARRTNASAFNLPDAPYELQDFLFRSAPVGGQCPFFGPSVFSRQEPLLVNCTLFQTNSCCNRAQTSRLAATLPPLREASTDCLNWVQRLTCMPCHPAQNVFYSSTTGRFAVCAKLCDGIFQRCEHSLWGGYPAWNSMGYPSVARLGTMYSNGREFCEAQGYVVEDGRSTCYSASSSLSANWIVVMCCTLFGFLTADLQSISLSLAALRGGRKKSAMVLCCTIFLLSALLPSVSAQLSDASVWQRLERGRPDPATWKPRPWSQWNGRYCPVWQGRASNTQPGLEDIQLCSWHSEQSCCTPEEAEALVGSAEARNFASSGDCRFMLEYVRCYICDPQQADYYNEATQRLRVCSSTCDKLFDRCADQLYDRTLTFREAFSGGRDYCQQMHFTVVDDSAGGCLASSAIRLHSVPYSTLLILALGWLLSAVLSGSTKGHQSHVRRDTQRSSLSPPLLGAALMCSMLMWGVMSVDAAPVSRLVTRDLAVRLSEQLLKLAEDALKYNELQNLVANHPQKIVSRSVTALRDNTYNLLSDFFKRKVDAVNAIAAAAETAYANRATAVAQAVEYSGGIGPEAPDSRYDRRFVANVSFSRSYIWRPRDLNDRTMDLDVRWTAQLDSAFQTAASNNPESRQMYIGTTTGLWRAFPGTKRVVGFDGQAKPYDPRIRPWYISAVSGPKALVFLIDCSGSMLRDTRKMRLVSEIVGMLLDSLTVEDSVNIVCARAGTFHVLSCVKDRLVPASGTHVAQLKKDLANFPSWYGSNDLSAGFNKAVQLLNAGRDGVPRSATTMCEPQLIYLSDENFCTWDYDGRTCDFGKRFCDDDDESRRAGCNYLEIARSNINSLDQLISGLASSNPRIQGWGFKLFVHDQVDTDLTQRIGCRTGVLGSSIALNAHPDGSDLDSIQRERRRRAPGFWYNEFNKYFQYQIDTGDNDAVSFTSPYLDAGGLGVMITVTRPAFDRSNPARKRLLGVIGMDVTLAAIEQALKGDVWGEMYAFLVTNDGSAVVHPRLRDSVNLRFDPLFPDISILETVEGVPAAFDQVRTAMLARTNGSMYVNNSLRTFPRGELEQGEKEIMANSIYVWGPVADSAFSFAYNARVPQDLSERRMAIPANATSPLRNYYHRVDLYPLAVLTADPSLQASTPRNRGDTLRSVGELQDQLLLYNRSTVKLPPRAWCDGELFIQTSEDASTLAIVDRIINDEFSEAQNPTCKIVQLSALHNYSHIHDRYRPEILLTAGFDAFWTSRNPALIRDIVWTYVGTEEGLFRQLPGSRSRKTYDPTRRPWYFRARERPGLLTLSLPYIDAFGAGVVVTLGRGLYYGAPTPSSCPSPPTNGTIPSGCPCTRDDDCETSLCIEQTSNFTSRSCAPRAFGVTAADILFSTISKQIEDTLRTPNTQIADLQAAEVPKATCGVPYRCAADPSLECITQCYVIDDSALLVWDSSFQYAPQTSPALFSGVTLGNREPSLMRHLELDRKLFKRIERLDWQGSCDAGSNPDNTQATLDTPAVADNKATNQDVGKIAPQSTEASCVKEVASFKLDRVLFNQSDYYLSGSLGDACRSAEWSLEGISGTNLLLLVMKEWHDKSPIPFGFHCHVLQGLYQGGSAPQQAGECPYTPPTTLANPTCTATVPGSLSCFQTGPASRAKPQLWLFASIVGLLLPLGTVNWNKH